VGKSKHITSITYYLNTSLTSLIYLIRAHDASQIRCQAYKGPKNAAKESTKQVDEANPKK